MTVNLLSTVDVERKRIARLRSLVFVSTSLVLVIYIGGLGLAFWSLFRAGDQQSDLTVQIDQAALRLRNLAEVEVVAAQVAERIDAVEQYMQSRPKVANRLQTILTAIDSQVELIAWEYAASEVTEIVVRTTNPKLVEQVVAKLVSAGFEAVTVESTQYQPGGWEATITFK